MEDTTVKPINTTEIELCGILDKIAEVQLNDDPNSTAVELPTSYSNTSQRPSGNDVQFDSCIPEDIVYNREVRRYAKKHNITYEKAFKRLYK